MALEFDENYKIKLANRLAIFENGVPTNPEKWEQFKKLPMELETLYMRGSRQWTAISEHVVYSCFNPIKDPFTNFTYRTSREQFETYCLCVGIECLYDPEFRHFVVRFDPINKIV